MVIELNEYMLYYNGTIVGQLSRQISERIAISTMDSKRKILPRIVNTCFF